MEPNRLGSTRAVEGAVWRYVYLFAQAGLSLGTLVGLALILPTDEFAPATVALGVLVVAGALADLGLSSAATTALPARIARHPNDGRELLSGAAKAFYWAAGIAIVLPLIAIAGLDPSSQLAVLFIAPAAPMYVLVAGADSILRATGELRRNVILVALNRAGGLAGLPVAALTNSSAWTCAAISVGTIIATTPSLRVLRHMRSASPSAPAWGVIRTALPLGVSQLFVVLSGRVNTILLGSVVSTAAAAAFETSWRLFQTGQYFAGGTIATGIAPFLSSALGAGRGDEVNRLLVRTMGVVISGGVLFSAVLLILRRPVAEILVGDLADDVARTLLPLAIVAPIAFAGFVGMIALSASEADRHIVLIAHAAGAFVNLGLAAFLVPADGAAGAGLACAVGLGLTQVIILVRLVILGRRLRHVLPSTVQDPLPRNI